MRGQGGAAADAAGAQQGVLGGEVAAGGVLDGGRVEVLGAAVREAAGVVDGADLAADDEDGVVAGEGLVGEGLQQAADAAGRAGSPRSSGRAALRCWTRSWRVQVDLPPSLWHASRAWAMTASGENVVRPAVGGERVGVLGEVDDLLGLPDESAGDLGLAHGVPALGHLGPGLGVVGLGLRGWPGWRAGGSGGARGCSPCARRRPRSGRGLRRPCR